MTQKTMGWSRRETLSLLLGGGGSWWVKGCVQAPSGQRESPSQKQAIDTPQENKVQAINNVSTGELPDSIAAVFQDTSNLDAVFTALMPAVVDVLQCDRCFLFIRDPQQKRTRITHGYSRDSRWPTMVQANWNRESPSLNAKDPLTLSAYQSPEAHFIEDIETAPPGTLDINLERSVFGHRALVHAPIYADAEFCGILEPCVFETPRLWTDSDRTLIQNLQQVLGSWIIRYLQSVP